MKEDKHKIKLVYPEKQASELLSNVDEFANRKEELDEVQNRRLVVKDQIDW